MENRILALIFLIILIGGCIQDKPGSIQDKPGSIQDNTIISEEKNTKDTFQLIYTTASDRAGWQETLTISNDGQANLSSGCEPGMACTINNASAMLHLGEGEMRELKNMVLEANISSYRDMYLCKGNCPTDLPGTTLKFIINSKEKSVFIYGPAELPNSLGQIMDRMWQIRQLFILKLK